MTKVDDQVGKDEKNEAYEAHNLIIHLKERITELEGILAITEYVEENAPEGWELRYHENETGEGDQIWHKSYGEFGSCMLSRDDETGRWKWELCWEGENYASGSSRTAEEAMRIATIIRSSLPNGC